MCLQHMQSERVTLTVLFDCIDFICTTILQIEMLNSFQYFYTSLKFYVSSECWHTQQTQIQRSLKTRDEFYTCDGVKGSYPLHLGAKQKGKKFS